MADRPSSDLSRVPDKSLWLVYCVLAVTGLFVVLVVRDLWRGSAFPFSRATPNAPPVAHTNSPDLADVFSPAVWAGVKPAGDAKNPFFTSFFKPPPPPSPKTTRKLDLTYQGFFQTLEGDRRAYVMVGSNLVVGSVGTKLIAEYSIADFDASRLTIKRGQTQDMVLPFRSPKPLEIPAE